MRSSACWARTAQVGADTIVHVRAAGPADRLVRALQDGVPGGTRVRATANGVEMQVHGASGLIPRAVTVAEAAGVELADLSVTEPTLETVFINLTGKELRD